MPASVLACAKRVNTTGTDTAVFVMAGICRNGLAGFSRLNGLAMHPLPTVVESAVPESISVVEHWSAVVAKFYVAPVYRPTTSQHICRLENMPAVILEEVGKGRRQRERERGKSEGGNRVWVGVATML